MSALLFAVPILLIATDAKTALKTYVNAPDTSFAWSPKTVRSHKAADLVSQTWHGVKWRHDLVFSTPDKEFKRGTAVVYVTGGEENALDIGWADELAKMSGAPVATLFEIPNQPIWDRHEDDLVAYTFERYLETGDETWPLLFPMVKSVVRAMDVVQAEFPGVRR